MSAMSSQNIDPVLAKAIADRGYATLTPVQTAVLEPQTQGRDLLVSARTGSGKTVAYGLVLADTLLGVGGALAPAGAPSALVIAPTRELAMQVQRELSWLYAGARVVSCVGGMDPRAERRALDAGCQIVVGTPGRLRDHLERGNLHLDKLGAVILDEADEMLDLGFREEIEEILDATPKDRRTLLFSATLPKPIVTLAATYQRNALRLVVGASEAPHADIDYRAVRIAPGEVELATVNVLRFFEPGAALVFCSTREAVRRLHANLVERGFNVVALSGEFSQTERTHALQALRDGRARVCVATDVAARGIDIPDLDLVIHADLPNNREVLQHRSGRTGRAGRKGVCVVLVPHPKRRRAETLFKTARIEASWQSPPSADDIRVQDQARLVAEIVPAAEASEEDLALARIILDQRSAEDIAAAYVRLTRARMPAPEDLAESEPEPRAYAPSRDRGDRPNRSDRDVDRDRGAPEPPRPGFEDAVWFKIDIGRNKNAEARWILPMVCRRGHATKRDIGAIRIFERETRFQVTAEAIERFEAAIAKGDSDGGRIVRLDEAAPFPRDTGPRDGSREVHRDGPRPAPRDGARDASRDASRDDPRSAPPHGKGKPFVRRDGPPPAGAPQAVVRPRDDAKPYKTKKPYPGKKFKPKG
jgi:ATP-dependent RNA helicase DeaD